MGLFFFFPRPYKVRTAFGSKFEKVFGLHPTTAHAFNFSFRRDSDRAKKSRRPKTANPIDSYRNSSYIFITYNDSVIVSCTLVMYTPNRIKQNIYNDLCHRVNWISLNSIAIEVIKCFMIVKSGLENDIQYRYYEQVKIVNNRNRN